MLVITRKISETFYIGNDICISILDIDRNRVRIGIRAPLTTAIYREELLPIDDARRKPAATPLPTIEPVPPPEEV